jgi:4-amino-4-deoxy-L-arabinose transferase-like glycosyltransferase
MTPPPSFFSLSLLLGGALIAGTKTRGIPRDTQILLVGAFGIRIVYVAIDSVLGIFAGDGDFPLYDEALWHVAKQWRVGDFLAPLTFLNGDNFLTVYTFAYGSAYAIFGRHPTLVRVLVAMTGVLFVYNVYRITRQLDSHRSGMYAAGFTAIYPYWIQLSGIFYRDMLVMLLLTEIVYLLLKWIDNRNHTVIILASFVSVITLSLRLVNIVPVSAAFAVATYVKLNDSRWQKPLVISLMIIAVLSTILLFGDKITVQELANRRAWLARENTAAYLTGVIYDNFVELLAFLPVGASYFFLVPFPWQLVNLLAVIALLQNVFLWYPTVVLSIFGVRRLVPKRTGELLILVAYIASGIVIYGLVEGNIGPAMRHRSQFQFVIVVLAGIALANRVKFVAGIVPIASNVKRYRDQ